MIRLATPNDKKAILAIADAVGIFTPPELEQTSDVLEEYFGGDREGGQEWLVYDDDGVKGVTYYAPELYTDGVWNLYFLAVDPQFQSRGIGTQLVQYVEQSLADKGERLLLIDTSSLPSYEGTRAFYRKLEYEQVASIRDFYRAGEDKIIFLKALSAL